MDNTTEMGFGGDLPPELQVRLADIMARRQLGQSMATRFAGGVLGGRGQRMMSDTVPELSGLMNEYNRGLANAVEAYRQKAAGRPEIPAPADELGGGPGRPATPGNPQEALVEAMLSQYGPLRRLGSTVLNEQMKANAPFTLNPGDQRVIPSMPLVGQPTQTFNNPKVPEHAIPENWMNDLPKGAERLPTDPAGVYRMKGTDGQKDVYQLQYELGKLKGSQKLDSSQIVRDANQNFATVTVVDPLDKSPNPRQITVRVGMFDPQKYIASGGKDQTGIIGASGKETDAGKREGKRQFNMQGLGATLQEAEDLLNGMVRDPETGDLKRGSLPTGSGAGALYDYGASLIGKSPEGAVEATKLKAVAGALTSKMPRMEGPQSDKDTALYKEMAAQVGDATLPVERRKGALTEVKRLWLKYERLNPEAFAERRATAQGDGLPTPEAIAAELARRKKK